MRSFRILSVFVLLMGGVSDMQAQTISLGTITKLLYCVNDTLLVPYTATGTFASDNQFLIQLSTPNGSFTSWTNSDQRSANMTGTLVIPLSGTGEQFRARVASSDPYDTSFNNGQDIAVEAYPNPSPQFTSPHRAGTAGTEPGQCIGFIGDPIVFSDAESNALRFAWQFGPDASPDMSINTSPVTQFSTPGVKTGSLTVTNSTGCATTVDFSFTILTCNPVIPTNARIVTDNEGGSDSVVWIKAGGTYDASAQFENQLVFVDPGGQATIEFRSNCLAYVRDGGELTNSDGQGHLTAILPPGMTIGCGIYGDDCDTFYCSSLSYDLGVSTSAMEPNSISFSQSPDDLYIRCEGEPLELRLMNVLGEEVLRHSATWELDCDLTPLARGVYFAVVQSAAQTEIRKVVR